MGASSSLVANRRRSQLVSDLKEDNERLRARVESLSQEAARLKAGLREIADSSSAVVQVPVQKLRFGTDLLYQCPLPNSKSIII